MRKWRKLGGGGGEIMKWTEEGQTLEGVWCGKRDGKFGALGDVETPEGQRVTFPVLTVLADRLSKVKEGELIQIVYQGEQVSAKGNKFKAFEVCVAEDDEGFSGEEEKYGDSQG